MPDTNTNTPTASAKLRQAATLITDALSMLDISAAPCSGCGCSRFHNFPHGATFKRFKDTADKLHLSADALDAHDSKHDNTAATA